ncbi:MAG: peptidase M36, partial [Gammaproteobacteria bacterium]|nr:peptidase M36 [Gammaproteobacteria bacterium]
IVNEQTTVTLDGTGSNDDLDNGSIASYLWEQTSITGTTVVLTNADTITATFDAPTLTETEILTFTLTVTDDEGATDIDTVYITVNPVNIPPVANAGVDQTVNEQTTVTLNGTATDEDGEDSAITYAWAQTVGTNVGSISDSKTHSPSFTSPTLTVAETLTFELTVTDDEGGTDIDTVDITVNPVNIPPVANAGVDQTVNEQTTVTLNGTATDEDGEDSAITYAWAQTVGTNVGSISDSKTHSP